MWGISPSFPELNPHGPPHPRLKLGYALWAGGVRIRRVFSSESPRLVWDFCRESYRLRGLGEMMGSGDTFS